ncbi:hypothetical protein [Rhizobium sp. S163]|uniref:hypothetical protein n=1 Tax=Rhizobium sp. S163 TaxID=3055039 RepID=UPI0025A9AB3F|nr:hypothetical protein [Rhizobium sp. S163]MDM9644375.1 hypothetical protein [Rhizobium sp. S163]
MKAHKAFDLAGVSFFDQQFAQLISSASGALGGDPGAKQQVRVPHHRGGQQAKRPIWK